MEENTNMPPKDYYVKILFDVSHLDWIEEPPLSLTPDQQKIELAQVLAGRKEYYEGRGEEMPQWLKDLERFL